MEQIITKKCSKCGEIKNLKPMEFTENAEKSDKYFQKVGLVL